jgi:GTP cyclohydrolase I
MSSAPTDLCPDDWRRIRDALRYLGRDLHHRSFSVTPQRRELLWQEMDRCLELADQLSVLGSPEVESQT